MQLRKLAASALGSLMAGATLAFPVAAADLEDLPEPFIEGEEAAFSMVVGETAATEDVVGAIDVAVSMGGQPTVEETVETEGAQGDWSAEGGVTLDTRNDDLYFGDSVDDVRETLTESDELDILEDVTFEDDAGDETDITSYLNVGDGEVTYGNSPDGLDDEDPVLHVPVDAEGDVKDDAYLFNLQSNFEDEVDFRSDDVVGEEIELFGQTFTVAQENQDDLEDDDEELILYGSSETLSMEDGDSETFEIDGDEHEIEVAAVNSDGVAYRVDGESIEQKEEDETFNVDGQQIRIDSVVNLEDDAGYADFAIGSEEYTLEDGEPVQDDDDDDIEGTRVKMEGDVSELSSLDLYVGAEDDEEDYLEAGDTFSHDFVPQVEVAFGGLNPDAAE
ncbi:MAG: S-layer protein, partial [Candidatus Aenigmatarchaeota archaeon]